MSRKNTRLHLVAIVVWTVVSFCFFQLCYPYHFFFQEQNQLFLCSWEYVSGYFDGAGCLARLTGDFLTQFYYFLYAGPAIVALCLGGIGLLLHHIMRKAGASQVVALPAALAAMTLVAVCHFSTSYRLWSTVSLLGWLLTIAVLLPRQRGDSQRHAGSTPRRATWWRWMALVGALPISYLLFGLPQVKRLQAPDLLLEKSFAVDCEYYFGHLDKVVDMVEGADQLTEEMQFFYYLAMAQRGELPDHVLKFSPAALGTFYQIGPETPMLTIRNMNELYWLLGDMTFTERAAMMTNVFSPNNRNVRMIRRLAECNVVSGDTLAAEKYLRILDKTLVHRRWAQRVRQHGSQLYREKRTMVCRHDTITTTDNAHFIMMQLLDTNPNNIPALDYILCSDLMLKDVGAFKRDYDRYCMDTGKPRLKKLYQEALCVWLAATEAPQQQWQQYIRSRDVLQRFQQYDARRGDPAFSDTYWYYFDKKNAPEL